MPVMESQELIARVERLERKNRMLTLMCGFCMLVPMLALVGWQNASDTARVKRLEVVDDRGVPLITLGAGRNGEGGSIVLRDSMGEKRSWWEVGPQSGAFTLNSAKGDGTNDTTLGLNVGPKTARMSMISQNGALLSANIQGDDPQVELYNSKGSTLFAAPLKPRKQD
jgi:hypothetical protein